MDTSKNTITVNEWLILGFISLVSIIGFIWSFADESSFRQYLVVEDGFTEWATVVALLIICVVCIRRVRLLWGHRDVLFLFCTALLALLAFFGAGEELSWGQRFIGWQTPESFQQLNAQGETNLHNLEIGGIKINKVVFGRGLGITMLIYLLLVCPTYWKSNRFARRLDRLAVPIARPYQVIVYLIIMLVLQGLMESSKKGEMLEFALSFMFLLNIAYPYNQHVFAFAKENHESASTD